MTTSAQRAAMAINPLYIVIEELAQGYEFHRHIRIGLGDDWSEMPSLRDFFDIFAERNLSFLKLSDYGMPEEDENEIIDGWAEEFAEMFSYETYPKITAEILADAMRKADIFVWDGIDPEEDDPNWLAVCEKVVGLLEAMTRCPS